MLTGHPLCVLQVCARVLQLDLLHVLLQLGRHTHAHVLSIGSVGRGRVAKSAVHEVPAGTCVGQIGYERCLTQRLHGDDIVAAFGMRSLWPEACPMENVRGREIDELIKDLLLRQPGKERMLLVRLLRARDARGTERVKSRPVASRVSFERFVRRLRAGTSPLVGTARRSILRCFASLLALAPLFLANTRPSSISERCALSLSLFRLLFVIFLKIKDYLLDRVADELAPLVGLLQSELPSWRLLS